MHRRVCNGHDDTSAEEVACGKGRRNSLVPSPAKSWRKSLPLELGPVEVGQEVASGQFAGNTFQGGRRDGPGIMRST